MKPSVPICPTTGPRARYNTCICKCRHCHFPILLHSEHGRRGRCPLQNRHPILICARNRVPYRNVDAHFQRLEERQVHDWRCKDAWRVMLCVWSHSHAKGLKIRVECDHAGRGPFPAPRTEGAFLFIFFKAPRGKTVTRGILILVLSRIGYCRDEGAKRTARILGHLGVQCISTKAPFARRKIVAHSQVERHGQVCIIRWKIVQNSVAAWNSTALQPCIKCVVDTG
mmetsp:Transcript_64234/g.103853  ORF Transcript_64234/g.103853 Transcript_64234/m.103853 type:complete len:226 (-) Transcript_64234:724-1401(-)